MFASPYLRRRASALAVFVSLVALAFLAVPGVPESALPDTFGVSGDDDE